MGGGLVDGCVSGRWCACLQVRLHAARVCPLASARHRLQAPPASDAQDASAPPEPAPTAAPAQLGRSSAQQRGAGAGAPQQAGGAPQDSAQAAQQERAAREQKRRPEPNPLRDLGDAMERWRADLAVAHEGAEGGWWWWW